MKRKISKLLIICMIVTMMPMRTIASEPPNELQLSSSNVINNVNTNSNESNYNKNIDNTSDMEIYNLCKSMDFTDEQIKNLISIYENPYYLLEQLKKYNILIEKNKGEKFTIEKLLFNKVDADEAEKIIANNNMASTLLIENKVLNDIKSQITTGSSIVIPENNLKEEDKNINIITTTGSSITTTTGAAIILYKDIDPKLNEELLGLCKNIQLDNEQIKKLVTFYENPNSLLEQLKIYNSLIQKYEEERNTLKQLLMKKTNGKDVEKNIIVSKALEISLESLYEKDTKALEKILSKEEQTLIEELIKEFSLDKEIWITLSNKLNKSIKQIAKEVRDYKKNLTKDKTPVADSELLKWISNDVLRKMKEKYFIGNTCLEISKIFNEFKFKDKEYIQLMDKYIDEDVLLMNLQQYKDYTVKQEVREEVIKKLLINGLSFKRIEKGLFLRKALSVPVDLLYEDIDCSKYCKYESNAMNEEILNSLSQKYEVSREMFCYLTYTLRKSMQEINDQIKRTYDSSYESESYSNLSVDRKKRSLVSFNSQLMEYDDYKNKIKEKNIHNDPPFSISQCVNEKVSTSNGNLVFEKNLFTVPGKNNTDFSLILRYSSEESARGVPLFNSEEEKNYMYEGGYNYQNFGLGDGWSFNLSYIQTPENINYNLPNNFKYFAYRVTNSQYKYLHLSDGRILTLKKDEGENNTNYSFEDKGILDLKFEACQKGEYNNGQNFKVNRYIEGVWDECATYKLTHKNGTREYFNYDGKLLGVVDANGNGYNIEYTLMNGNIEHIYPSKIISTLGDEIKFTNISLGVDGSPIIIEYADQKITLNKSKEGYSIILDGITRSNTKNANEEENIKFDYLSFTGDFTFSKYITPENNSYALLTKITYPTGVVSEYKYKDSNLYIEDSAKFMIYRVEDQKLEDKNNECYHFQYVYSDDRTEKVNKKTDKKDIDYYNEDHLLTCEEEYTQGQLVKKCEYTYNDKKLKTKSSKKIFNLSSNDFILYEESFNYDDRGNLIEYTDVLGNKSNYTYDTKFNKVISEEKPINGQTKQKITYQRDQKGNIIKKILYNNGDNIETNFQNASGEVRKITMNKKDGSKFQRDINYLYEHRPQEFSPLQSYKRIHMIIDNVGVMDYDIATNTFKGRKISEQISYDWKTGDIIEYKDRNGNITKYEYDYRSRMIKQINPNGTFSQIIYDDINNVVMYIDENGFKIRNVYDGIGNLLRKEEFIGNTWQTKLENIYDSLMRVSQVKDANGNLTSYTYDDLDRVTKITYADGTYVQYIYDDVQNTKTTINEEGHSYKEYFDKLGRLIKKETNDGEKAIVIKNEYDFAGNLIKVIDANGNETKYVYDNLCRLIKTIDALGQETKYDYDELNQLVKVSTFEYDPLVPREIINEITRTQEYDQIGRVIKKYDEELRPTLFKYDGNGNIIWTKDMEGQIQTFNYNSVNKLSQHFFKNQKREYEYDPVGRVRKAKEFNDQNNTQNETTSYDYYEDGKLKTETLPDGKSISYAYDAVGNILQLRDYFGNNTTYNYDQRNRTKNINFNGKVFGYEYYNDGMIKNVKYPNANLKTDYTYDLANRIKALSNMNTNSSLSSYAYKTDAASNIVEKNDNGNLFTYNYDGLNRIKGLVNKSKNEYHNYDYDVKSNIAKEEGDYSIYPEIILGSYKWNPLGLVESFTTQNGQAYNYKYNHKGLRNKKISNGEITSFYYLGDKLIGEEKGASKTSYVRGNNVLAKVIDGKYYYYFYNRHGDVVQIVDEAGNVVNKYDYDEYGRITNKEEKIENAITYAGEYLDKESGNYYLKARYYNPQFRRFISKDSYEGNIKNPLSLNVYIYCGNNPLKYIDPSGHERVEQEGATVSRTYSEYCIEDPKDQIKAIAAPYAIAAAGVLAVEVAGEAIVEAVEDLSITAYVKAEVTLSALADKIKSLHKGVGNPLSNDVIKQLENAPIQTKLNKVTEQMEPYMKQVLGDDYKLILRRDVGEGFSHGDLDHWNIEVQTSQGNMKFDRHLYVDVEGNIQKIVDYIPQRKGKPIVNVIFDNTNK